MIEKLFHHTCWEALPGTGIFESPNGKKLPTLKQKGGPKRVIGRKIEEVSPYLGFYGIGGPGFFGFLLEKKSRYPQEWIVLRTWGASHWLLVNGKWLEASYDNFDPEKCYFVEQKTMFSDVQKQYHDLFNGKVIEKFELGKRYFRMKIGELCVEWPTDLTKLPPYGIGTSRKWVCKDEKMEDGFIISPTCAINI